MALRFCDGFDSYASGADLTKKWASTDASWTWASSAGRFGGGAISNAGATAGKQVTSRGGAYSVGADTAIGFYVKASGIPAATSPIFTMYNNVSGVIYNINLNLTTGFVGVTGLSSGNIPAGTINVCDGGWHWIEYRCTNNTTSYLYVDGVVQPNGGWTGVPDHCAFNSISGITVTIDDLVGYDGNPPTDGAGHNFPLNARQIITTRPASDSVIGFSTTSSGSTHYNLVNEVNPDGDTSYVQDGTGGDQDLLNFGALGYTPTTINGAIVNVYVGNPLGGTINVQGICKSGAAAQSNATAVATPISYQTMQYAFPTDPNTSAAWTASGLNAAKFGYKNA